MRLPSPWAVSTRETKLSILPFHREVGGRKAGACRAGPRESGRGVCFPRSTCAPAPCRASVPAHRPTQRANPTMRPSLLAPSLLPLACALQVYHRLLLPSLPAPTWSLRASLDLTAAPPSYAPAPQAADALLASGAGAGGGGEGVYQVALAQEGSREEDWPFAGVRACYALSAASDSLILRLSSAGEPYTLAYALVPAPAPAPSASCPPTSLAPSDLFHNTTLVLRSPDRIPPLALKVPPKLSESGEAVKPEPEKSFIQKYWMYLLPVMLLLLVAPGGGEGEGGGGGGGR
ncbi:hypothetical protein CALCODRAFT_216740 [Calocera cornea HHB12733]|uniref:Uncharacterized protein n=1 Tax=Calocera cornea HHB12733 TaxID=1353952 RepID=A0A165C1Q3_9BASI|nr:hypothetical protein CALCODRAFT_216740 [Calocera cornea HHB12733]